MWRYTHYGFYNINGSYYLLLFLLCHRVTADFRARRTKGLAVGGFLFCLLLIFLGHRPVMDVDYLQTVQRLNQLTWTNAEFIDQFDRAVTDSARDGEVFLDLLERHPQSIMALPPPFNRMNGYFNKSVATSPTSPNISDIDFYHPRQPGSLMIDNFAVNLKETFIPELPRIALDGKSLRCLGKRHALVIEEWAGNWPRALDIGSICPGDCMVAEHNICVTCSGIEFYSSNFRSPINGQMLNTIDMGEATAFWWRFTDAAHTLDIKLPPSAQDQYRLTLTAINAYEIVNQEGELLLADPAWPDSKTLEELPQNFVIQTETVDDTAPRFIASLMPKDASVFVASCGSYGSGRLCSVKGDLITQACSEL